MSDPAETIARIWYHAHGAGGTLLFAGNGGSAADASHVAAELAVRFRAGSTRPPLRARNLGADIAVVTAAANDFGYSHVFSRQVSAGLRMDCLTVLSTSGASPNVLEAWEEAEARGMRRVALIGGNVEAYGDPASSRALVVHVEGADTAAIQEATMAMLHRACAALEVLYEEAGE